MTEMLPNDQTALRQIASDLHGIRTALESINARQERQDNFQKAQLLANGYKPEWLEREMAGLPFDSPTSS